MKFVCGDCKHEQYVEDRSFEGCCCPECGSENTKIILSGSKIHEGGKLERTQSARLSREASKGKRSIGSACLGFLVGLIGVPAAFIYFSYQMYEQGTDILGWENGGYILIAIALGLIGSVIGPIIGYFSGGSSEKLQKGREVNIESEAERRKRIKNNAVVAIIIITIIIIVAIFAYLLILNILHAL